MESPKKSVGMDIVRISESTLDQEKLPSIIEQAGHGARFAYEEFFHAKIRNSHTRRAYRRAVANFLEWCESRQRSLHEVSPADVEFTLSS